MIQTYVTLDGNEAVARVAHAVNEVIAIYPITPSSSMGEWADQWSAENRANLWGTVPRVVELQSEGGAAGAVHGALQAGALTTTFTASQGLLLMIPNMYKIAGELTSMVIHVAARALATSTLSIFGDHSDVMAARGTGFVMLVSNSVQEAQDFALIAQMSTLEGRVPVMHFFDGFRTSAEVMKIELLEYAQIRALIDDRLVQAHRARALSPEHPFIRGTASNPDAYFQMREAVNPYYRATPTIMQNAMDRFAAVTGRQYRLFEYSGAPNAERVIVVMGSGAETVQETVQQLTAQGERIGLLKVRLFRPFDTAALCAALPATTKSIAVLDRVKEPGSAGEPLYLDVVAALNESWERGIQPRVIGGRFGLASKEFTPAMVKAVYDHLSKPKPKNHFTIGINDDLTFTSLDYDPEFSTEDPQTVRAVFFGLGADGTVGANKNSIKIIGEDTDNYAQGFFVYDSKKSGSMTISHLRFGPRPIHSTYLISQANFLACHQFSFLERFEMLHMAAPGAVFLLNSPYGPDDVWAHLPRSVQQAIIAKHLKFYVIDGNAVARETGMGGRINTILQTCFFAISGILPRDAAIAQIKHAIEKTYGKRGELIVERNYAAVDAAIARLYEVKVPAAADSTFDLRPAVPAAAPEFVQRVTAPMIAARGDELPVSALPADGTFPSGTTQWEKRNIAQEIPVWDDSICIQCGKCVLVCPHAVIRAKVYDKAQLAGAPATFMSSPARWKEFEGQVYSLQVAPEDCTGCGLCVEICPVKNKSEVRLKAINMQPQLPIRDAESENWEFFLKLPEMDRSKLSFGQVKDVQLLEPLFEFSLACAGCGETPYIKLLTQLFGDRLYVANATGCSSIYGGNLPTTPWTLNKAGRGPAWANSLFEDNAEFGLGMRLALNKQTEYAGEMVKRLAGALGGETATALLDTAQHDDAEIAAQRSRVSDLKTKLDSLLKSGSLSPELARDARELATVADALVRTSVWIIGGDGWAYDIGYGGLDHVLASGNNVKVMVLDTEVYSNTGGQMSKATPMGAVAKFAAGGKPRAKKDLAMLAMTYGNIYVARIAMGGNDGHTLRVLREAEAYDGPALIIAYSHCIAHGYDMVHGMEQQKNAVLAGYWPLFRYNPDLLKDGKNPLQLDSKAPSIPLQKFAYNETRYTMLAQSNPPVAKALLQEAQSEVLMRWHMYENWAAMKFDAKPKEEKHG
ncbi:MAG: pyruvate:ferredoxin (flavodoxin) oxidoreductase [Chloroflexi bacterium]|nr:pyruvate:ferredoxin (flavodoxin) oxidoreductase [Chloroflexota bacterium]